MSHTDLMSVCSDWALSHFIWFHERVLWIKVFRWRRCVAEHFECYIRLNSIEVPEVHHDFIKCKFFNTEQVPRFSLWKKFGCENKFSVFIAHLSHTKLLDASEFWAKLKNAKMKITALKVTFPFRWIITKFDEYFKNGKLN